MNWLTLRLSELNNFSYLARNRIPTPDPGLGLLPFNLIQEALSDYRLTIEGDFVLDSSFLLTEDAESAAARADNALAAPPEIDLPPLFTRALDDDEGNVLYLPDGLRRATDVQLFSIVDNRVSRIRASGQLDQGPPRLRSLEPPRMTSCPDGPCPNWGDSCGAECQCMKFEIYSDHLAMSSLPSRFLAGRGRAYELKCVDIHNA